MIDCKHGYHSDCPFCKDDELATLRTRLAEVERELEREQEDHQALVRESQRVERVWLKKIDSLEADAAVMRVALEQSKSVHKKQFVGPIDADFVEHQNAFEACRAALATDAGKSLLERLKEAERLLIEVDVEEMPTDWYVRRDSLLHQPRKL